MTTKKTVSHSHSHSTSSSVEAAVAAPTHATATSETAAAVITQVTPTSAPVALPSLAYLTPPPSNALIPPVPSNFVPESGTTYRAVVPKKAELVSLPLAVADLRKFSNYSQVLGSTAPPYEEILQTFDVTNQWSSMRTCSSAWDIFSRDQEGICWGVMRPSMESLKLAFDLAATRDPSLPAKFPGLATLLGVKKSIAVRGASTRRLNKKALAEGKAPVHGAVGKKRLKATNKAIVAAANAAAASDAAKAQGAGTAVTPVVAPTAPSAPVQQPVVAPVAVVAAPVAAAAATPIVTTGSPAPAAPTTPTNGAPAAPLNGTSVTPH